MREVVVLGVGLHKFGRFPDKPIEDIGREAILNALIDSGVNFKDIECAYCGRVYPGMRAGLKVVTQFGQTGIPVVNIEQACSSSSTAFREAYLAIAEGRYDVVLAVGFEKMPRGLITGTSEPGSYDEVMGFNVTPAWHAMLAKRHMLEYGTTKEQFAMVAVKNHRNGALNPYAQYQKEITLEEVLNSRMIADPITLYQCSPTTDGASAAVLCSREKAGKYTGKPVIVVGYAGGTSAYQHGEDDELMMALTERLARQAYERTGIGPKDIDVAQLHDCFSSAEILRIEACGFCPMGEAGRWIQEGKFDLDGELPINTDGGLLSRGHPIGATGLAQIAEIVWQLRGDAGPRQVPNAKVGMCQNTGLGGANVHIFKR